jgi:spermidine synthase
VPNWSGSSPSTPTPVTRARADRLRGVAQEVQLGHAELIPDDGHPDRWNLLIDGTPQSYVDLSDPLRLEYEYIRWLAAVLDAAGPVGAPVRVLHLGGGALTLPRYLAATRPGSSQRVVERDAALIALVRRVLPPPRQAGIRIRCADARAAVAGYTAARFQVVIADVFRGARVPAHLTTVEFARAVAGVLVPGGLYAVNLTDTAGLAFTRTQVATLRSVFAGICLVAEVGVLKGRRFGNVVLVASAADGPQLPVDSLRAAALRDPFSARCLYGAELDRFAAGARPVSDAEAVDSPEPPPGFFR